MYTNNNMPIPYTISDIQAAVTKAGGKRALDIGNALAPTVPPDASGILVKITEHFMASLGFTSELMRNAETEKSVNSQWVKDRNKEAAAAMIDAALQATDQYVAIVLGGRSPELTEAYAKQLAMTYFEGRMMVVNDKWPVSILQSIFGGGVAMQGPAGAIARSNPLQ